MSHATSSRAATVPPRSAERRASVRQACQRDCLVFPAGGSGVSGWYGRTFNLSATGMALILLHPLQPGTELRIEPQGRGRLASVRARVVRCTPQEFAWFHGCALDRKLSEEELRAWIG